jgi:hypothetical protein
MRLVVFALLSFLFIHGISAQSDPNDPGARDTVALNIIITDIPQSSSVLSLEAWVYSDETIRSFSGKFSWDNPNLRLDSAHISPLLFNEHFSSFLYDNDDLNTSNATRIIQLGGCCSSTGLAGNASARRLWATYYFTITDWQYGDSVSFNVLPDSPSQLLFVRMGPFYPVGFHPIFDGPLKFPEIQTGILVPDESLPWDFVLYPNYPNPFNPLTKIEFELEKSSVIDLSVFNLLGQKVATLHKGRLSAGHHLFSWEAITETGDELPSGVYFYRLQSEQSVATKKMLLIR